MSQPMPVQVEEQKTYMSRSCPLCGAASSGSFAVASEPKGENLGEDVLESCWSGFYKEKVFFSYERCASCGLLYAPQFFDGARLARLYAQMAPNMDLVPESALRRTQKGYFDLLKRYASLKGGYIEIGPDVGYFTACCVREGAFDPYWLFEPNRAVWPALEKTMSGKPHQIVPDMLDYSRVPDQSVGAAVMIQVLDHLLDPLTTLREIKKKMKPGAVIAVVTHDESSMLARLFGTRWPAFCLQHPQIYNPKTICGLLEQAGFTACDVHKTVNYFTAQFLVKQALWAFGIKVKNVPSFGGLVLGLKLGNMLAVAKAPNA